jgi:C4-type Zn-finger protein
MFKTVEVAKNSTPEVLIKCPVCKKQYSITDSLKELPLKVDYGAIVEGVLVCPHCQNTKHVYYMTEHLRNEQRLLQEYAMEWQRTQSDQASKYLLTKQRAYQNEYDRVQKKYQKEFGDGTAKK